MSMDWLKPFHNMKFGIYTIVVIAEEYTGWDGYLTYRFNITHEANRDGYAQYAHPKLWLALILFYIISYIICVMYLSNKKNQTKSK